MAETLTHEQMFTEVRQARELMGDRACMGDPERRQRLIYGLGLIFFRCPDDLAPMVTAQIIEVERRGVLMDLYQPKEKPDAE